MSTDFISFHQYHLPPLTAGDYEITVEQKVEHKDIPADTRFTVIRKFSVRGDRFSLKPADVGAVFPPAGSLGDHSNVLPHIILNRSTLPWERLADHADEKTPWLALLLFYDEEAPKPQIVDMDDNKATVIDVPRNVMERILPGRDELAMLAHVREATDYIITDRTLAALRTGAIPGDVPSKLEKLKGREFTESEAFLEALKNEIGDQQSDSLYEAIAEHAAEPVETAVIICNRLPKPEGASVAHLVSVEGRYNAQGFDYQGAGENDLVRLVSLQSWSFACIDHRQNFTGLLQRLDCNPSVLRLPDSDDAAANKYLAMGAAPLWHELREGGKTVSWYHGPLATAENRLTEDSHSAPDLPARAADELARYSPADGMFDVSYAAAWELGRLLALQNKTFSVNLFNWKRAHARQLRQIEDEALHLSPLYRGVERETIPIPPEIAGWFRKLSLLEGVPFNYLVPDERMLPLESIRFFQLDWLWMECLLDGAFSVGRVTSADHERDHAHETSPAANPHAGISGLLMRSEVVAGWPGLLVDGFNREKKKLGLLRMDRLSANVLLCLFEGEVAWVDFHLRPEMAHFGLDVDEVSGKFHKQLRGNNGKKISIRIDDIEFREGSSGTINISKLAKDIENKGSGQFTSAQFAMQMIENSPKLRFSIKSA